MADDRSSFSAPRGTYDVLPPESRRWRALIALGLDDIFAGAGYEPIDTPVFEHTEVFERGVGAASEVVNKQMYSFQDRAGRSLTLRPEGTAPVIRAVLEHRLDRGALPVKLSYAGPMFRQERPQRGRYRQFMQVGIEAVGSNAAAVDAEVIELGDRFVRAAGVTPRLLLNSIGHLDASCRHGYLETLTAWLRERVDELPAEDRARIETNPLRTFDSKEEGTRAVMADAPLISDHLCASCTEHFGEVRSLLDDLAVDYVVDQRLVRGLDYYTRTAFEFVADNLGAQSTVLAGGRYDGLAESLGGRSLPGIGFASGVDRVLLAADGEPAPANSSTKVYIVALGERAARSGLELATELRRAGIGADLDLMGRGMKGQMKDASRSGARWAVILGEAELEGDTVTLKDLGTGEQKSIERGRLIDAVNTPSRKD